MQPSDIVHDAFSRVGDLTRSLLDGLDPADLVWRPDPEANTIAWLVWHLDRVQDAQVAELAGGAQVWDDGGWGERFGLGLTASDTGYGDNAAQVARLDPAPLHLLAGYHDQVCARTLSWIADLRDPELSRVIDDAWDPPVTVAARLVSIAADDLQHIGQAAYLRGAAQRARLNVPGAPR